MVSGTDLAANPDAGLAVIVPEGLAGGAVPTDDGMTLAYCLAGLLHATASSTAPARARMAASHVSGFLLFSWGRPGG